MKHITRVEFPRNLIVIRHHDDADPKWVDERVLVVDWRKHPNADGTKMEVRITDNGVGIAEEDQARLFLPFHTTKGTAEKGTGLGMFMVWELVRQHGGDIRLERSAYGKGTTFLIELPIPEEERQWLK